MLAPLLRRSRGFTLVELMVVVAIIGMLAAAVGVNVMKNTYKAQVTRVRADFDSISNGLKLYKLDMGRYPRELNALWEAPTNSRKWGGPYLDSIPRDPWGSDYVYTHRGGGDYELLSYGADQSSGGQDEDVDLSSKDRVE